MKMRKHEEKEASRTEASSKNQQKEPASTSKRNAKIKKYQEKKRQDKEA